MSPFFVLGSAETFLWAMSALVANMALLLNALQLLIILIVFNINICTNISSLEVVTVDGVWIGDSI
jgi:hypothetical protein